MTVSRKIYDLTLVSGIRANTINKINVEKVCVRRSDTFCCTFCIPMNNCHIWIWLDNIKSIGMCWLTEYIYSMNDLMMLGRQKILSSASVLLWYRFIISSSGMLLNIFTWFCCLFPGVIHWRGILWSCWFSTTRLLWCKGPSDPCSFDWEFSVLWKNSNI